MKKIEAKNERWQLDDPGGNKKIATGPNRTEDSSVGEELNVDLFIKLQGFQIEIKSNFLIKFHLNPFYLEQ